MPAGLNEFYGSESQLRMYHARYVHFLNGAPQNFPVLDLGCGSGVFMELAREHKRAVRGVEQVSEAAARARAKGLDVAQDDALRFLDGHPNAFSFIYCSHLIEHFAYGDACRLLELCQRALVSGGRLHVNTPNPASLEVIAENFWLDPTHVRPYPLPLLAQMMQHAGFNLIASGYDSTPALPRRTLARRLWLRLALGRHYGHENTFIVGEKT
ncbi:MAG: class I SAM-dependent methyltransferase [Chloroflexi bacterium]|nr:class I SAM-dependent methyltransferase [Chloroflexota bacterium]